jgi:transposase
MPHLSDYSLRQMDDDYVRSLDGEAWCSLTLRLLADLKTAREPLEQNPTNRSRPTSSQAPWVRNPPKTSTAV